MSHTLPYLPNCSLLFREVALLQRPAAAKAAGFDAVEFWWPFESSVPPNVEVDAFVTSISDAGVKLVGLNFPAGDLFGPDAGILSLPARAQEFDDSIAVAVGIGERLGIKAFNALYGNRVDDSTPEQQDEIALERLVKAARAAATIDATVLIEAVSGPKPYPLRTAADAAAVVERLRATGAENVGILCDLYHLAANGEDLDTAIAAYADRIEHVQIADLPGRHEPGTGQLELDRYLTDLQAVGYDGWVSLEYNPSSTTTESLAWLPSERRASGPESYSSALLDSVSNRHV